MKWRTPLTRLRYTKPKASDGQPEDENSCLAAWLGTYGKSASFRLPWSWPCSLAVSRQSAAIPSNQEVPYDQQPREPDARARQGGARASSPDWHVQPHAR